MVVKNTHIKDYLYLYNGKSFAQSKFYQGELKKTLDELKDKMIYDGSFGDKRAVQKIHISSV